MPKPRWRLSFGSFFRSFFDPEKHEQLQESKAEIDAKVQTMLRDLKEEENNEKHAALAKMIEEIHSHYIMLYERYDHLTEELKKEADGKHAKKGSSSSSDSSDSDHTPKKKGSKNGKLEIDRVKQELQIAFEEVSDLQLKLASSTDEREALRSENLATLNKLEEAQKATTELSSASEKLNEEKGSLSLKVSQLEAELIQLSEQLAEKDSQLSHEQESFNTFKGEVKEKLEAAEKDIDDLNQKKRDVEEENKNLCLKISELGDEIKQLGDKIEGHANEVSHLTEKLDEKERAVSVEQEKFVDYKKETDERLESADKEIVRLRQVEIDGEQEKRDLSLKISEMEAKTQQAEEKIQDFVTELHQLNEKLSEKERALASQLEIHEAHKEEAGTRQRDLELELQSLLTERREFEEKKTDELAALLQKLTDTELQVHTRDHEASQSQVHIETLKEELAKRELELGGTVEEKESLLSQLTDLKKELDLTRNQKIDLDEELKSKSIEISSLLLQLQNLKEAGEKQTAEQQEKEENLAVKLKGLNVEVETLTNQIHEFEEKIRSKEEEVGQLKDANEKFEKLLIEKENELSTSRKEFEDGESRNSALIADLTTQISSLQENLSSLAAQKSDADATVATQNENILEYSVQIEKLKEEFVVYKKETEEKLESADKEIAKLRQVEIDGEQEKRDLSLMISEMEAKIQQAEEKIRDFVTEVQQLNENLSEKETALASQLEIHEAHKEEARTHQRDLELELQSLLTERREFEEKKTDELAALLQKLTDTELQVHTRDHEASQSQVHIETLKEELAKRELELGGTVEEKESLLSQLTDLKKELDLTRNQKIDLDEELKSKSIEISSLLLQLQNLKEAGEKQTAEQQEKEENLAMKLKGLNVEVETLTNQIHEFEEKIRSKEEEVGQLKDANEKFERLLIEKESELSTSRKEFEAGDSRNSALITDLTAQVSSLEESLSSLAAQKSEADAAIAAQNENILEFGAQIEKLKEELLGKTADGERGVEEKTILELSVKKLQQESETLQSQIGDLEAELSSRSNQENQLREENGSLRSLVSELENSLRDQVKNFGDVKNQLENLQAVKIQLEELIEKHKQETIESLAVAENSHVELANKITDLEKKLKEKDDEFIALTEEDKNLKVQFESNAEELRLSLKKIEEISQSLQSETNAKTGLEVHVEELRRHVDIKSDEISSLIESLRNTEVKEKLTSQRLHVAEQMLNEKDESFTRKEDKLKEEQKLLTDKVATLMERISVYSEAQKKITTEISHKATATLSEMDTFLMKFEEDYGHMDSRIYEINHELKVIANWISEINTNKDQMKADELILKGKITELESELQKGVVEKASLVKSVQDRDEKIRELENRMKEKEVGYVTLSEEKREAIRQLCIWIEYHRDRYDHLKNIVVRGGKRRQQIATA